MNTNSQQGLALVRRDAVCEMLGISRSSLARKRATDPSFPKPIKDGGTRQAPVYFVRHEIEAYIRRQMATRGAA